MKTSLLVVVLALQSCTSTRRFDPLPLPPPGARQMPVQVVLDIEEPRGLCAAPVPMWILECEPGAIEAALRASGSFEILRLQVQRFTELSPETPEGDGPSSPLHGALPTLELTLEQDASSGLHFLGLLTLGLAPHYREAHLVLYGTLRAPGGHVLARAERHELLGGWRSSLLGFSWEFGEECVDEALTALVQNVAAALVEPQE